jgi:hypothetical protein
MENSKQQSAGGKACAIIQRQKAIDDYNQNPNMCKFCGSKIEVGNQKVSTIRRKKFCNKSCAASFNNFGVDRSRPSKMVCKLCGEPTQTKSKICLRCFHVKHKISFKTKGELFSSRKNWQSAASGIRKDARSIYLKNNLPQECFVCGYDKHYQVCHKTSVSDFDDTSTIEEINHPDNLVALCPNHHWEFDHGLLIIKD